MSSVKVTSRIPHLTRQADERAHQLVQATVLHIEQGCKIRSRVDTGLMRAGWTGEMTGRHAGRVTNPVEHTKYNEYGTVHMSAQPMLVPAVEEAREPFRTAAGRLYRT